MTSTHFTDRRPWLRPWWQYSKGNGPVLFYIVSIHALALAGLILFPAPRWPVLLAGFGVLSIGGIGTTVCSHRCLAHRSLRLNPVIENLLIFFTIFNASGEPMNWVANHRQHHAKADTAEDVSSPRHGGFWWAHIRWVYQWSYSDVRRWCPDLDRRRYRVWRKLQALSSYFPYARDCYWGGKASSGLELSGWSMPYIFKCSSIACCT